MGKIEIPFGDGNILSFDCDEESKRFFAARTAFVLKYMKEHGLGDDVTELSLEQLFEVREQEGWKNPCV